MGRPDFTARKAAADTKPSNPFAAWVRGRKERRREMEEQASRMITDEIAKNETTIIDQLNSIDFLHSRLPKSVLEEKTRKNQSCCDLEYACQAIIRKLLKEPQTIKTDIREIDRRLLTLTLLLKQAVEQGDTKAAYAAKGALVRGINEIRARIPQNQPQLAGQFVEKNAAYLDEWIELVGFAQIADRTKQNVEKRREACEEDKAKRKKKIDALGKEILNNPGYAEAFRDMSQHDTPEERAKWTPEQRDLHRQMVDQRIQQAVLELGDRLLQQEEMNLLSVETKYDVMREAVAAVPIVSDPDLMNKFQESLDKVFEQLAAGDADVDEMLKTVDDIEGRIMQLDNAPGAIRAREVAAEQARKLAEQIGMMQKERKGADQYLKEAGLSSEALKQLLDRNSEKEHQAEDEMMQETVQASEFQELDE